MKKELAQEKAIAALVWLSSHPDLTDQFLGASGLSVADLRHAVATADEGFLTAVVEFISQNDAWVLEAAQSIHLTPDEFVTMRHVLLGSAGMHWT
ncbi:DUF3572 domain-containing protein [Rhodobacteraceae bacterium XHP0102]|nr:DUF3572 domain-containing protein [Rhodobacteraceae bacterium XHP0102]